MNQYMIKSVLATKLSTSSIVAADDNIKVVHLPQIVYQILYDIALQTHWSPTPEERQTRIYKEMCTWVDDNHLGWGIINFIDLSAKEVLELSHKYGTGYLDWGMYIVLQKDVEHIKRYTEVPKYIDAPVRQIITITPKSIY